MTAIRHSYAGIRAKGWSVKSPVIEFLVGGVPAVVEEKIDGRFRLPLD
jgi:hypothetical protein